MQSPGFLFTILAFLLMLGPLVFFHELGHYFVGRWFGIGADVFSIGFGKEVVGWTDKRGTRWKVSALPLGGYVKFTGDMSPAGLTDPDWLALPPEQRARTFQSKPVWQRALVVLAGPVTNFILAFLILFGFALAYGDVRSSSVVGKVESGSTAQKIDLRPGDHITAIGGRSMTKFEDVAYFVMNRPGQTVQIDFDRNGMAMSRDAQIGKFHIKDKFGNEADIGRLGITPAELQPIRVGLLEAPGVAFRRLGDILQMTSDNLGQLITGQRSIKEMGGPVRMAAISGQQLSLGWSEFIGLVALISINLGFINLLPVPMLDGGHLLFYAIEAVRRRPVTPQIQEWAYRGGLAAVLMLFLVVTFNDLNAVGLWKHLSGLIG